MVVFGVWQYKSTDVYGKSILNILRNICYTWRWADENIYLK